MSLVATKIQNWRVNNPDFDKNMARPLEYGALDFFASQTEAANSIITDELKQKALNSMGTTVQIPVINYDGDVTVANTRSCVIEDNENTSALYSLVFTTYQVGFTMVPAAYSNNEIDYQRDFNRKMEKIARALATSLDTAAVAALEANKTKVFQDALQYATTGNELAVPFNMATEVLGDINPIMRANAYPGQIHIIGNAGVDSLVRKLAQHSIYNDVNKQLEYADKVLHFTTNVANETGKYGTFFAVEDGNVAVVTRVDREAARGASANGHEWGITNLPFINLPVGYHYYTSVGDQSSIAGAATEDLTCGVKEYYGFSVDVAFLVAYNSDTTHVAQPIIRAEVASPAANTPVATPVYVTNAGDFPSAGGE